MLSSVEGQYVRQVKIASATASAAQKLWRRLGDDFSAQWQALRPQMLSVVESGRAASVVTALPYTAAVLAEQGVSAPRVAELDGSRFVATAPSGAPLATVLDAPVVRTRSLIGQGTPVASALEAGGSYLAGIVLTLLADTRRAVYGADITSRPKVGGYVRMLEPPSCSRCVILAGRFYRWNAGFQRHPRCDCEHIPTASAADAQAHLQDPYEYFNSLSKEQQDKVFGSSQAQSIRDGADIYRVENVRMRGLSTANGRGRDRWYSTMTVDDVYEVAGDNRDLAISLLREQGYIKDRGQVVAQAAERFSSPISRAVVPGSNRDRVLTARMTGQRDPLDTVTMTAQERRLYDAWYKANYAETRGGIARSTTGRLSSSDMLTADRPASSADVIRLRQELDDEFARQFGDVDRPPPESVENLAHILGLI